jgi:hypothetical protein
MSSSSSSTTSKSSRMKNKIGKKFENVFFYFSAVAALEPKKMFIKKPTPKKDEFKVN